MSSNKWLEAARRYEKANPPKRVTRDEEEVRDIQLAADHLDVFVKTSEDGRVARELLAASGKFVRFAEESQSGMAVCWVFTGDGLFVSSEHGGTAAAYASAPRAPKLRPATPQEMLEAWKGPNGEGKETKARLFMNWLRKELDNIADLAP